MIKIKKTSIIRLLSFVTLLSIIVSCDMHGCGRERALNIEDPDVQIRTDTLAIVEQNYVFSDTTEIFIFAEQKVVLTILFDQDLYPLGTDAQFHVFAKDETLEGIKKWVNNNYTEGSFTDAATPIREEPLPTDLITITPETIVDTGNCDNYKIDYAVDSYTIPGLLTLSAFSYDTNLYYKCHDPIPLPQ